MITSSIPSELNTGVKLTLIYRKYKYMHPTDTNVKAWVYTIPNNTGVNTQDGIVRVSNTITYKNEGINKSQAYIDVFNNNIPNGFIECYKVVFNSTGSKFSGDTLSIKFSVYPTSGPAYSMRNKYLKQ